MKKIRIVFVLLMAFGLFFEAMGRTSLNLEDSLASKRQVLLERKSALQEKNDTLSSPSDTSILEKNDPSLAEKGEVVLGEKDTSLLLKDSMLLGKEILPLPPTRKSKFQPNEERGLWLAALVPGLGQIYNRKYWKLPIVFGAIIGLTYGIAWNADKYSQYSTAYKDLRSGDPNAKSYMDFFPIGTKEENIDKGWLERALKSNRDAYRNDRDLCIICLILAYGLTVLDAYVDSALFYFDISPNLAMNMSPKVLQVGKNVNDLALGLTCSLTF